MTDSGATGTVEPNAIVRGGLVAVAVVVPAGLVQYAVRDSSGLVWLLLGVILVGLGAAGSVAAGSSERGPLTNGGLAALAGFFVVQAVNIVVRLAQGDQIGWAGVPLVAMLATSCGVLGAWIRLSMDQRRSTDGRR